MRKEDDWGQKGSGKGEGGGGSNNPKSAGEARRRTQCQIEKKKLRKGLFKGKEGTRIEDQGSFSDGTRFDSRTVLGEEKRGGGG